MTPVNHVDTWIFDLDNTLYPASCRLFDQMHVRMSRFIVESFGLSAVDANALRRDYFLKYGTTLRGLMIERGMKPAAFLDYVHDIDYSAVAASAVLGNALERLPGRKLVFTNGTTAHARRVLDRLGCARHFEAIYDIVDSDYVPKPARAPYEKFLRDHAVTPETSAFFEDIAQNLEVPHAMGMMTVLVESGAEDARLLNTPGPMPYVHHTTKDLAGFLSNLTT